MSDTSSGAREHFGTGNLKIDPARSVFINCPFDSEFMPLFDAIVFATACCGFLPRSALETGSVAEPRMDRITRAVFSSKYSIHDLSRCRGEGSELLARFNMPLEFGIAMARRFASDVLGQEHDWLLLVPEGHQYVRFISDLAGFDPKTHSGTVDTIVPKVMAWLATRPDAVRTPTPKQVTDALPAFSDEKARLNEQWMGEIPWADLVIAALHLAPAP
jgi:hypothetical protein